jgi:hypothetical protein
MGKALIRIGYNNYAMDISDAVAVMEIMGRAEMYQAKRNYKVTPTVTSYHVWGQEAGNDDSFTIQLLPDTVYRVAKLAGKPQDN